MEFPRASRESKLSSIEFLRASRESRLGFLEFLRASRESKLGFMECSRLHVGDRNRRRPPNTSGRPAPRWGRLHGGDGKTAFFPAPRWGRIRVRANEPSRQLAREYGHSLRKIASPINRRADQGGAEPQCAGLNWTDAGPTRLGPAEMPLRTQAGLSRTRQHGQPKRS